MKTCSTCGEEKSSDQFWKSSKNVGGLQGKCKTCSTKARTLWGRTSNGQACERRRAGTLTRTRSAFACVLRSLYGITVEEWARLFNTQNGACAICNDPFRPEQTHNVQVDHNHLTGTVRQLLCLHCNRLLGACRENATILFKAVDYLARHSK